MKLEPRIGLSFDGTCTAALAYYEAHLGAAVLFKMTWGDSPMAKEVPVEWHDKVMHATWTLGSATLAAGDTPPGGYREPVGFSLLLGLDDPVVATRLFEALAQNGLVTQPLQETFWAKRFGAVTDQFGIPWTINCE
jgi:PhnB protein